MPDQTQTIIAVFEAETAGFTEGAEKIAADSKAIQESTAGMGQSFTDWGKETGAAFTRTSDGMAEFSDNFSKQFNGLSTVSESASKSFTEVSSASRDLGGAIAISDESANKAAREFLGLDEATKKTGKSAEDAKQAHEGYHGSLMNEIQAIIQIVQMIGQWIGSMAKENEAIANTVTAMTTLSGSTEKAAQAFNDLDKSAAAHDFGIVAIGNAEKHLMMLGVSADEASKEIQRISDAIASVGGNANQVEPVVVQLQKIKTESRVTKQEIDQLASSGLDAWKLLADQMGISVEQAQKRVTAGAVTGSQAFNAIMDQSAKYSGAADAQSQSLGSEWTRLGENASKSFGPFLKQLAAAIEQINELYDGTSKLDDAFRSLGDSISKAFSNFGSAGSMGGFGVSGHATGIIDSPVGHMAMVGEDGPEPMWIPQGASVFPSGTNPFSAMSSSAPALSGGSGMATVNITHQIYLDSRIIAQATIPHIAPMARQQFGRRA
jgi:tape measure domain-containing protein